MSSTPKANLQALVALLIAAATVAGSRVYSSRYYPLDVLPAIAVYPKNDRHLEYTDLHTRQEQREQELIIELAITANSDADLALLDFEREVRLAIHADALLGQRLQQLVPDLTVVEQGEAGEDPPVLLARMTYRAEYHDLMT